MAAPVRFLFDTDFSVPPPEPELAGEELEEETPKVELEVHLEELRKVEARAHERGFAAGEESAAALARQQLAREAGRVAEAADRMIALVDDEVRRIERDAVLLAETIAGKLAGHLLARFPQARVLELIEECLAPLRSVRHLAIRINEVDAETLRQPVESLAAKKGFEGRLLILGEPDIARGDCRIEWADGGVIYEKKALVAAIDQAVRAFLGEDEADGADRSSAIGGSAADENDADDGHQTCGKGVSDE